MINFVKYRRYYYLFSAFLIIAGIVAMVISSQTYAERSIVRLSIDFVGGSLFQVRFAEIAGQTPGTVTGTEIQEAFSRAGVRDVTAQALGIGGNLSWQVRGAFEGNQAAVDAIASELTALAASKNLTFDAAFLRENVNAVSPIIGNEVSIAAVVATAVASVIVLGWIVFAFRKIKNAFRYGVCALVAMLHDVLIMIGAMSILGLLAGWQADALFVTGLLTVIGYSVQDTIVVYDRIRENEARRRGEPYEIIVNRSLMETVQRSLMTQIAVAFVLVALFLAGGGPIHQFVGVLLIGLLSGTYSSIFVAVPLVVSWEKGEIPFVNRKARAAA